MQEHVRKSTREVGACKELEAKEYLIQNGYEIVTENYHCKAGEIDLIARENHYLVFIEVKYRRNANKGLPQDAVHWRKRKRITTTAKYYMMVHGISEFTAVRFDVITMLKDTIEILQNAFDASE